MAYVRVLGQYKMGNYHVKITNTFKSVLNMYTKHNNVFKPVYTYDYEVGGFGGCSASCGGGTQTRSVTCKRRIVNSSNNVSVSDAYCTAYGLSKPTSSQSCNTHSCAPVCEYVKEYTCFVTSNADSVPSYALFRGNSVYDGWNGMTFTMGARKETIGGEIYLFYHELCWR